jgi:2-oxoglutarate dehydrogenase E2 component (dihydrolipoamide succinyltransferase)
LSRKRRRARAPSLTHNDETLSPLSGHAPKTPHAQPTTTTTQAADSSGAGLIARGGAAATAAAAAGPSATAAAEARAAGTTAARWFAASATGRLPTTPFLHPHHRAISTSSAASYAARTEVVVPPMGDSISEGTVAAVLKNAGEAVAVDEVVAQIETDKVTIDVRCPVAGAVTDVLVKPQDTVVVGQAVVRVEEGAAGMEPLPGSKAPAAAAAAAVEAPAAAAAAPPPPPPPPPRPAAASPSAPAPAASTSSSTPSARPERRVKMTRLRMRVAERLKGAQNTYAMLTTFNEIDMTGLTEMRAAHKDAFLDKYGVKLGFMSAFVKAAALALSEVPAVNAVIDGNEIVYRDYVDVSIAVATPKGLVVPVLRDADQLDFAGVERAIADLGRKARDGTISVDDMAGGTFTISNGGVYGSMLSTPIINPPQSAILGMHNVVQRAVVLPGGKIEPRPVMYAALTYDHRLIDGREAVTFLKRVKETVEDPTRLLLGV